MPPRRRNQHKNDAGRQQPSPTEVIGWAFMFHIPAEPGLCDVMATRRAGTKNQSALRRRRDTKNRINSTTAKKLRLMSRIKIAAVPKPGVKNSNAARWISHGSRPYWL